MRGTRDTLAILRPKMTIEGLLSEIIDGGREAHP